MKVNVRLFGTLGQRFSDYHPAEGLHVEIPHGARVENLLDHLGLSGLKGCVVAVAGRIMKPSDLLENGMKVNVLQSGSGG